MYFRNLDAKMNELTEAVKKISKNYFYDNLYSKPFQVDVFKFSMNREEIRDRLMKQIKIISYLNEYANAALDRANGIKHTIVNGQPTLPEEGYMKTIIDCML